MGCTDQDTSDTLAYSFLSGNAEDKFKFVTGVVKVKAGKYILSRNVGYISITFKSFHLKARLESRPYLSALWA